MSSDLKLKMQNILLSLLNHSKQRPSVSFKIKHNLHFSSGVQLLLPTRLCTVLLALHSFNKHTLQSMDSRLVRVSVHMCPERLTQHSLENT